MTANDTTLPWQANYEVGSTVLSSMQVGVSPFTTDSMKKFIESFKKLKNKGAGQGNYSSTQTIATTYEDCIENLNVKGSLHLKLTTIEGGAEVEVLKGINTSSFNVSFMVHAKQKDRFYQLNQGDFGDLELTESVKNEITKSVHKFDMKQFVDKYGLFLITGQDLGGSIIYVSTYETSSTQDKLAVQGSLQVDYENAGISLTGSASGSFHKNKIKGTVKRTETYEINPTGNQVNDGKHGKPLARDIVGELNQISTLASTAGKSGGDPDPEEKKGDSEETDVVLSAVWKSLSQNMQAYLSSNEITKPVNAIVVPLSTIPCVNEVFIEKQLDKSYESEKEKITKFIYFTNDLNLYLKSLQDTLESLPRAFTNDGKNQIIYETWSIGVNKTINQIESLIIKDLATYAEEYRKYVQPKSGDSDKNKDNSSIDEKKEEKTDENKDQKKDNNNNESIFKPLFWENDRVEIDSKFKDDILKPYNKFLQSQHHSIGPVWSVGSNPEQFEGLRFAQLKSDNDNAYVTQIILGVRVNPEKYIASIQLKFSDGTESKHYGSSQKEIISNPIEVRVPNGAGISSVIVYGGDNKPNNNGFVLPAVYGMQFFFSNNTASQFYGGNQQTSGWKNGYWSNNQFNTSVQSNTKTNIGILTGIDIHFGHNAIFQLGFYYRA